MDLRLRDKKAVVTGGTRGIGRAIAEALADERCALAICARQADEVQETVAALLAKGVMAVGDVVDVADGAALRDWVKRAGEMLGGIDILVSNPTGGGGPTEEDWANTFGVDVMGAVRSVEAARPFLVQAAEATGDAAVVVISSVSALEAENIDSYGPMKAALIHLAKGMAKELGPKRVRANAISPGPIYFRGGYWDETEQRHPDVFKRVLGSCAVGRMGTPEDIANAAVFLASPVSSFITGINLVVDGACIDRVNF